MKSLLEFALDILLSFLQELSYQLGQLIGKLGNQSLIVNQFVSGIKNYDLRPLRAPVLRVY